MTTLACRVCTEAVPTARSSVVNALPVVRARAPLAFAKDAAVIPPVTMTAADADAAQRRLARLSLKFILETSLSLMTRFSGDHPVRRWSRGRYAFGGQLSRH